MNTPPSKPGLMRSLGRFVGEITKAVAPARHAAEVSRTTKTETRDTEHGTVTLRRTTIEEVIVSDADASGAGRPPSAG